jgi:hypothetical protein
MKPDKPSLKLKADRIARSIGTWTGVTWDNLRDVVDGRTGGELHPVTLDILTDMVMRRLPKVSE